MIRKISDTNTGGIEALAQAVSSEPNSTPASSIRRRALFGVFIVWGFAILILGSNYFKILPTNQNLTYNLIISAACLVAALWLRYTERWHTYWRVAFAFFIASVAYPTTLLTADWVARWMNGNGLPVATTQGRAIAKVAEGIVIVLPILFLTKLSGADLGSIYLKRGNLKWGLSIGSLVWLNFVTSAMLFFGTRFAGLDTFGAAVVWGLIFSFTNGFMEEVWLRGIFLKRFAPFLGIGGSVLLTSTLFALMHGGATYLTPVAIPFMLVNTFTLGLACGYLMMKTDSIWGAVLIHAAADFFLFFAMLANA